MPPRSHLVDDFANRSAGSLVGQGWTVLGASTAVNFTVETEGTSLSGRRVLMDKTTSDLGRKIAFDAAGTPDDVEVLARVKMTETVNFENGYVNVRASAVPDTTAFCYISGNGSGIPAANRNKLWFDRIISGGSPATIGTAAFSHSVDVWYWMRVRANGTTFSAKIWEYGSAEPAFMISDTAAEPTSGAVAMGCFESDDNYVFDYFSVGLDGATAPFPAG